MQQKTVFVGLSGGVDSSVAALRLKRAGYRVVGVFIKVWHPDFLVCNWEQERLDAMRVAAHLEIPFLTCDAEAAYRDEVADYFIESYRQGFTPNPDVMCNQAVKFGAFIEFAKAHKADYVATGHYAQVTETHGHFSLKRGIDTNKDQSYFLWTLTQAQLAYTLLPVGNDTKEVIRQEAAVAGIPTATKKDSQGVCFLGHIDIPDFLSHYIDLTPGPVIDTSGVVVGEHRGAFVYTIGQRHGFTLTNHDTSRTPHYVVRKDVASNTLTVSTTPPQLVKNDTLTLIKTNEIDSFAESCEAQTRYRQTPFQVHVRERTTDTVLLSVDTPTETPAAGQSCVLYRGDVCLGGGIIV